MEIGSQNIHPGHPLTTQANLKTEMQVQDRGPDSIPPVSQSNSSSESNTSYDNTKSQGRYLDTKA
ncbi:hypothetical protein [Leptospira sp. GIMC2001]|uniref:hypothetical protein n=1 Tax=Leptospira sp. GIMC2001 TaxID=1513297 RepID=UPI00234A13F6|nr:hypothetical protein [Leptospira sp. GIMC2001]WCL50434.1 hypothetical protein O4O04_06335 [Leptospira sp. GIMC2001]